MREKSLGRGLEDISQIFLSKAKENPSGETGSPPDSVVFSRKTCRFCIHFISACMEPTCRIFTFDFERYGVAYAPKINPDNGPSCRFYQYEEINRDNASLEGGDNIRLEDILNLARKMEVKKNAFTQKNMRKILFEHLEEGYEIKRVIMEKHIKATDRNQKDRNRKESKTVEVDVFVTESP